jgi:hypothetical protein
MMGRLAVINQQLLAPPYGPKGVDLHPVPDYTQIAIGPAGMVEAAQGVAPRTVQTVSLVQLYKIDAPASGYLP